MTAARATAARSAPARLAVLVAGLVAVASLASRAATAGPSYGDVGRAPSSALPAHPADVGAPLAPALLALDAAPLPAGLLEEAPRLFTNKLDDPRDPAFGLLRAFHDASVERPSPGDLYLASPWGRWGKRPWWSLGWRPSGRFAAPPSPPAPLAIELPEADGEPFATRAALPLDDLHVAPDTPDWLRRVLPGFTPPVTTWTGPSLRSDGYDTLWAPPPKPIPWWKCRRNKPTTFVRYGGESDAFHLLRCDGSVAPEALDRLSLIARPADAERPGALLPDEPDPSAWAAGEWLPHVRLVHPRLVWLLQRIAESFPRKAVYVYSGYRPPKVGARRGDGSHHSQHAEGRAMDIEVYGVPNTAVFKLCRTLDDVGCGFYPNSKFVHVDVRRPGTGHAYWIDDSHPGEPSHYVDAWPGVVESGALVWGGAH